MGPNYGWVMVSSGQINKGYWWLGLVRFRGQLLS